MTHNQVVPGSSPGGPTKTSTFVEVFYFYAMAYCYILYSQSKDKYYVGATQVAVEERLDKHNQKFYRGQSFTSITSDWELFLTIQVKDFNHALRIEKHIKRMKSKTFIQNLKKYPELLEKTVAKTHT